MTRLITPDITSYARKEYVEHALAAAEAARKLHNALHAMRRDGDHYNDPVAGIKALEGLQERLDAVADLESELLEHAMRVTIG